MDIEIRLQTSGVHDEKLNLSRDVHSRITISLTMPGVVTIYNEELIKEGIMELLKLDNAITNYINPVQFEKIKS